MFPVQQIIRSLWTIRYVLFWIPMERKSHSIRYIVSSAFYCNADFGPNSQGSLEIWMWIGLSFLSPATPQPNDEESWSTQNCQARTFNCFVFPKLYLFSVISQILWGLSPYSPVVTWNLGDHTAVNPDLFEWWFFNKPFGPGSISHEISPNGSCTLEFWKSSKL